MTSQTQNEDKINLSKQEHYYDGGSGIHSYHNIVELESEKVRERPFWLTDMLHSREFGGDGEWTENMHCGCLLRWNSWRI